MPNKTTISHTSTSPQRLIFLGYLPAILLLIIPIGLYYATIFQYAYNFPYEDDLNSALSFLSNYSFGQLTAWGKLTLIFSQYNEHRIVFDRLVFLSDYALFGQLNFRHLILIGNIAPLLTVFLLYKGSFPNEPRQKKLFYLLPAAYVLFSFQYWELSTWSMAALQNLFVIPFALFSLYSLCRPGRTAFVLACVGALLATFTSGNGMFTFMVGIPVLLQLKEYRKLVLWMAISGLAIGLYFLGYIRPPYHPDIADSLFNHPGRAIRYFFTLVGSMAGLGRVRLAVLMGVVSTIVSVGLLGYLWYKKKLTAHLPLISWLLFLYATCLSLMASRSGMGVEQAFTPRYGIVVVMLFATQTLLLLETIRFPYGRIAALVASLGIAVFFYVSPTNLGNKKRLEDRTLQMQYNSALYHANPATLSLHWGNTNIGKAIYQDAHQKGIYTIPTLTFSALRSKPQPFDATLLKDTHNLTTEIQPYQSGDFLVFYRNWVLLNNEMPASAQISLIAQSPSATYQFETHRHTWEDHEDHTLNRQYTHPGFSCVIDKKDLKPGQYRFWVLVSNLNLNAYQALKLEIDF